MVGDAKMIDLEKMAKEHEKLFPNATLESQIWKLEEEIREFFDTGDYSEDELREIADVCIVCAGLYRWCPCLAYQLCSEFYWKHEGKWSSKIEKEVNRKWQVNLKRKWEWNGKTYKHIGTDGNE